MESRIPVPTDNIYKFYALFGLLLCVFSMGSVQYVTSSANQVFYSNIVETESLKSIAIPTMAQQARLAVLQKQTEITKGNRTFFLYALGGVLAIGGWLMWHGFRKWHGKVQPVLDEMAEVQLQIAKLQLRKPQNEMAASPKPSPTSNTTAGI